MSRLIASISGIRGIPGESLDSSTLSAYAHAFCRVRGPGAIVIGRDGRPSGAEIAEIFRAVALSRGHDVIDLGIVPTPTVQIAVEERRARGGVIVTASHNPGEWNGLKFLDETGVFFDAELMNRVYRLAGNANGSTAADRSSGRLVRDASATDAHIARVLSIPYLDLPRIAARRFRVVVDAVNASGSAVVPALLRRLGCDAIELFCDGSGVFPHTPEPLPENLVALGDAVRSAGADLGVAVDPDADRLALLDERGEPFGEEYTIATAVESVLSSTPAAPGRTVVVNLSTTRAVDDVATRHGATVLRTPVGEINVVAGMRASGVSADALIGGEGSGGVILPTVHSGRDSLVGIALALHVLSRTEGPASAFRASLPDYAIRKAKYPLGDLDPARAFEAVRARFARERCNTDDGLRIDFADGWVHLRRSNTEPVVRVIAEARTGAEAERLAARLAAVLRGETVGAVP